MMRIVTATIVMALAVPAAAQKTADYDFAYRYPARAARIAPLKAWLDADKATLRATVARDAAAARREAGSGDFPFRPFELQKTWEVVSDTPRFLSLSLTIYGDTGGAHGSTGSGALVWDKQARRRLNPRTLFVSDAALHAAVMTPWCRWMRAERVRRLGPESNDDTVFGQCPPIKDVTVLPGSSNGRTFDRIGVIADQYVVGAYVEGPYEHTLPVTAAVLRAVKPEYRAAFAARSTPSP